jgi:hypothetical protein
MRADKRDGPKMHNGAYFRALMLLALLAPGALVSAETGGPPATSAAGLQYWPAAEVTQ